MESGLAEIHQMGITSHAPVRVSSSEEVSEGLHSHSHRDSMRQYVGVQLAPHQIPVADFENSKMN
eukprot:1230006-Amphidinium_carterae.1